MAKKKKNDNLMMLSATAQNFTVSAAVLYGVLWLVTMLYDLQGDSLDALGSALMAATVVGGIVMGLLHLKKFLMTK